MGESVDTAGVWIRPEDADQPKLERLRRVVAVNIGPDADVAVPWLVWGNGLPRSWLFSKLESGAQVLILPPWPESGFAGLPAVRTEVAPSSQCLYRTTVTQSAQHARWSRRRPGRPMDCSSAPSLHGLWPMSPLLVPGGRGCVQQNCSLPVPPHGHVKHAGLS